MGDDITNLRQQTVRRVGRIGIVEDLNEEVSDCTSRRSNELYLVLVVGVDDSLTTLRQDVGDLLQDRL